MFFLKKRKDVLAVILTSSDILRARRAYDTLKNCKKTIEVDVEIIVNSLNKNYLQEIKDEFKKDKVKITEAESNGLCGKGKNSVLDHFRKHKKKYNYLMPIDGDDFFYPSAFEQFEKILIHKPDIIGLQRADEIVKIKEAGAFQKNDHFHHIKNNIYMNSWNEKEFNLNIVFPKDPEKGVLNQPTPDRVMFLSEKLLKNELDLHLPEKLVLYDDYVFDVYLYEKAINKNYSYAHTSSSFCYVYDRSNDVSISSEYRTSGDNNLMDNDSKVKEINQEIYNEMEQTLLKCKDKVDFGIIPHFKLGMPKNFTLEDKLLFVKQNII